MKPCIRVYLSLCLIVLLPAKAVADPAPSADCDSLALVQASFLLDEPDRQPQLTIQQLELLGRCKVSLMGIDLTGRALGAIDLRGADLTDAELAKSSFGGPDKAANLRGIRLDGANLENADLRAADLQDADLRHTFLSGAKIAGANLSGAELGWPQSKTQADQQKLTPEQLSSACWDADTPPSLSLELKDYKRPANDPSGCTPTP